MKIRLSIVMIALCLTGCTDKNNYEQAVLADIEKEKDVTDYKIEPEYMADCVVDLSSKKMPGFFPLDPYRLQAYRNYTKMLTLAKSADPKQTLEELRTDFGSAKKLAEAHSNYTESYLDCISAVIMEAEKKGSLKSEPTPPEQTTTNPAKP